jgi:molybdopterin molybdotransferase
VTATLEKALAQSDVVLLTGGVSVGDYDFVLKAANNSGVKTLFHKIKQRPGKPLFFGKKESNIIFGLPGNPSSVLTCFYEYVMPALGLLSNKTNQLDSKTATLTKSFAKPVGLTQFLKAFFDGEKVSPLDAQESYRMHSFARANCFIVAEEQSAGYEAGEVVAIHLLPC